MCHASRVAELPAGAVTFLFTDVEGSTQLVKQLRDRYPQVLADHGGLLREFTARTSSRSASRTTSTTRSTARS
jgi:class 3 adenylate cyclase